MPVPMSCVPVTTVARPSAPRRTSACAGGPPPPHQIWQAAPRPRRRPSGPGSAASASRSAQPASSAARSIACVEALGGVGQPARLVELDAVSPAELERIDLERLGELVDRLLEAERSLHHARRAVRVGEAEVEANGERRGAHVLAAVERRRRHEHRRHEQPADAHRDHGGGLDRRERAVAARADPVGLHGGSAMAGGDALAAPVVDEPDGPAGDAREMGREQALDRGALLRAEAAAHELAGHVHAIGIEIEALRELAARVEDALRRDPRVQLVLRPVGDGAVGLERVVDLRRRAVLGLDDHVGLVESGLDVAALALLRILGEALIGEPLLEVDHEAERRPAGGERRNTQRGRTRVDRPRARRRRHRRTRAPPSAPRRGRGAACRPGPRRPARPGPRAPRRGRAPRVRARAASAPRRPRACRAARCRRRTAPRRTRAWAP